jgi:hypothetical protein
VGRRSRATFTVMDLPSNVEPFRDSMARSASSAEPYSTNPKPRDWPVARSMTTLAETTSPNSAKASCSC